MTLCTLTDTRLLRTARVQFLTISSYSSKPLARVRFVPEFKLGRLRSVMTKGWSFFPVMRDMLAFRPKRHSHAKDGKYSVVSSTSLGTCIPVVHPLKFGFHAERPPRAVRPEHCLILKGPVVDLHTNSGHSRLFPPK